MDQERKKINYSQKNTAKQEAYLCVDMSACCYSHMDKKEASAACNKNVKSRFVFIYVLFIFPSDTVCQMAPQGSLKKKKIFPHL